MWIKVTHIRSKSRYCMLVDETTTIKQVISDLASIIGCHSSDIRLIKNSSIVQVSAMLSTYLIEGTEFILALK